MKDLAVGKKYKIRKAGRKGQHTSIHKSFTENLDGLPTELLTEKLNEAADSNSFDNLIFRERHLLQTFLQARDLPFEQERYDENGNIIDFSDVDILSFQGRIFRLQGLMKEKYDHIAGATIAADGLNCISAIEQYCREQKLELALHYAMELVGHARDIHLIRHENLIHAGRSRTDEAIKVKVTKAEKEKKVAWEWMEREYKKNSRQTKHGLARAYAKEHGRKEQTVVRWFSGKKYNLKET